MNRTEARRKWGEAYGNWYWANRHKGRPEFIGGSHTKAERVAFILDIRKYRVLMRTAPPEQDAAGNTIYRQEEADKYLGTINPSNSGNMDDRYYYDFKGLPKPAWKQYDTKSDAWYFGVWVNIEQRMIFSYAEGDRTLTVCPDVEHLRAELNYMAEFYGDPPPAVITYDRDGARTEYYDTRPSA